MKTRLMEVCLIVDEITGEQWKTTDATGHHQAHISSHGVVKIYGNRIAGPRLNKKKFKDLVAVGQLVYRT